MYARPDSKVIKKGWYGPEKSLEIKFEKKWDPWWKSHIFASIVYRYKVGAEKIAENWVTG